MKRMRILLVMMAMIALTACGGGGGGGGGGDPQGNPEEKKHPPVAAAHAPATIGNKMTITLDGSGSSDADNDIVAYQWTQTAGTVQDTLVNANSVRPQFVVKAAIDEVLKFELKVTDAGGRTATAAVEMAVVNSAPQAHALVDKMVDVNDSVELDGTSSDPDDDSFTYQWVQKGGPAVSPSLDLTQPKLQFKADGPRNTIYKFELTVADNRGATRTYPCFVSVKPYVLDVLYTAYAGAAGYKDNLTYDAHLYLAMVNDLNALVPTLLIDTISNDPDLKNKIITFLFAPSGTEVPFSASMAGGQSTMVWKKGDALSGKNLTQFSATLRMNFNADGYYFDSGANHPCTYTGTTAADELVVEVSGYYLATIDKGIEELYFKDVHVTASPNLTATYHAFGAVTYNQWQIAYAPYYGVQDPLYQQGDSVVPVNMYLLPADYRVASGDNRDYTLGGAFTIDGNTYAFTDGFRYRQIEATYGVQPNLVSYVMTSLNGSLRVPGLTEGVTINTPFNIQDPIGSNTIVTHRARQIDNWYMSDLWTSGVMGMTGYPKVGDSATVVFKEGAATFSSPEFGTWTVTDWQQGLAPF